MELRIDRLLARLRDDPEAVLGAIDADPLLLKRVSGDLVLANASRALYTPVAEHQLFAKGIVYRRDPLRLVSMPLVKIYNLGERGVSVPDLLGLLAEHDATLRFLRKMDGSLIQVFRDDGRVYFTTRGMLDGASGGPAGDDEPLSHFDYLGAARSLMRAKYPAVLDDPRALEGRTLLFELLHPEARVVTDYGDRADLVLLTAFDRADCRYVGYEELCGLALAFGLTPVDMLTPPGHDLAGQVEGLLAMLAGTDQEGSVLTFERGGNVVYRIKVKTPEYLQLMRLMAFCTYERTVEMLDARPGIVAWADLEAVLREQGRDKVPEEVLGYYRDHWERFQAYLRGLQDVAAWARAKRGQWEAAGATDRKSYAALATKCEHPALAFAAYDDKLDVPKLRKLVKTDEELRELKTKLGLAP